MWAEGTEGQGHAPDAVFEVVGGDRAAPFLFVCEHASHVIPARYADLGIAPADRFSHAVWDPGAEALTRHLTRRHDAPAMLARISRAVYDLNRPPERADAVPASSELIAIPGNRDLDAPARARRAAAIHDPFHAAVSNLLDAAPPGVSLVTVHSFNPVWHDQPRDTEIGLLHDTDAGLSRSMLQAATGPFRVALNQPYSAADGVTYTLARHATARGLSSVMIEVRNDLLSDDTAVARVSDQLAAMLGAALGRGAAA